MMEIEDLKSLWASLDERLKNQEILQEKNIREMIRRKANKSLKQLSMYDGIGVAVLFLVIPFIVYAYGKFGGKHIVWDATVIFSGVFCVAYLPFLVYRVYALMKIDLFESIKNNLLYINRYTIQIKREKILMVILIPALFVLNSLVFVEAGVDAFRWIILFCLFIFGGLYSYWAYKKLYDKNILSIRKCLDELKELEE